jgi:tetraacyldisaccharide 4'-kinase
VPILVGADRVASARRAVAAGADVCVLDDGFQHRRLRRALDIVLIDATNPLGFGRCLPRGLLREPPGALRDAHAIVITRSDLVAADDLERLRTAIKGWSPRATIATAVHTPSRLIGPEGRDLPVLALAQIRPLAFCGLGNPRSFFETVRRLGGQLAATMELPDHARYTGATIESIRSAAAKAGADALITTQKDAVKLADVDFGLPLWQVAVEVELTGGGAALLEQVARVASGARGADRGSCIGPGPGV